MYHLNDHLKSHQRCAVTLHKTKLCIIVGSGFTYEMCCHVMQENLVTGSFWGTIMALVAVQLPLQPLLQVCSLKLSSSNKFDYTCK